MQQPFYWIDAFADRIFKGNPAGVCPLVEWLPAAVMQSIAFENGLAETAFYVAEGEGVFHIRWFTPTLEVELCGHATLATAFVVFLRGERSSRITFKSLSGILHVRKRGELLELDFPARPPNVVDAPEKLVAALGSEPTWVGVSRDYLAVFPSAAAVAALRPNFTLLGELDLFGVIVSAPGEDVDFVSRFFVPKAGINEDPVTGSAHCTLIPYWACRLGKTVLTARQISLRSGDLFCESAGDRVKIGGRCSLYLAGELFLPEDLADITRI